METELKLTIAAKDIALLARHPLLAGAGAPREIRQLDVYYDTPAHGFWQRGYALRVRCADGNHVQAFKGGGASVGGLHVRDEWESGLADGKPDLPVLAGMAGGHPVAGTLLTPDAAANIVPVFTCTTTRTLWRLHPAEGCEIECVLDVGSVRCGRRRTAVAEVELELKRGEPGQLIALALALNETLALRIENASKAERGYALAGEAHPPSPASAQPVALPAGATLDDAFQRILQSCLEQVEANTAGTLARHAECLHQMRVGLRRLRAALDLFKTRVQLPARLSQDVDWLAGLLGKARDWDVLMMESLEQAGGGGWTEARLALRRGAERHAAAAHQALRQALRSRRHTRLVLGLAGWILGRQWRQPADGVQPGKLDRSAHEGVQPMLRKAQRRLRKRLRQADPADTASLHRVRIAAKKSRYAAQFFQPLLPSAALERHERRMAALQDVLGGWNDLANADALLADLENDGGESAAHAAYARGYLAAIGERRMKALRKTLKRAMERH